MPRAAPYAMQDIPCQATQRGRSRFSTRRSLLAAAPLLPWLASARAADPIVLRFSHVVAPNTPKGRAAEQFRLLAESRTQGRVRVEVHPNSELYTDRDELEALQLGAVQMLAPSTAKFAPLGLHEFEVFDLPYVFADYDALRRVTRGEVGQRLLRRLQPKGIVGLGFWDNGFKQMSANKPLRVAADYAGLTMRVQPSEVIKAQMRALGARPRVMAFSEAVPALRAGAVDGTENPTSNFLTQRFDTVQSHLTLTDHGYLGYALIVNARFWNGLPRDIRAALDSAAADATRYANEIAKQVNDEALAEIERAGRTRVLRLTPTERGLLQQALWPVHQQMRGRVGGDLLDAIYRETGQGLGRRTAAG